MKCPLLRKQKSSSSLQHPRGRDSESPTLSLPHGADHRSPDDATPTASPAVTPRAAMRRVTEHQCMVHRGPAKDKHAVGRTSAALPRASCRKPSMLCPVFHKPPRASSKKSTPIKEEAPAVPEQKEPLISNKAFVRAVYSQARQFYLAEKSEWEPSSPKTMARRAFAAAVRSVVRSTRNNLAVKSVVETWLSEFRSSKDHGEVWEPELEKQVSPLECYSISEDQEDEDGEAIMETLRKTTNFSVTQKLAEGIAEALRLAEVQLDQLRDAFRTQLDGLEDLTSDMEDELSSAGSVVQKLEAEVSEMRKHLRKSFTHACPGIDEVEEEENEDDEDDEDDDDDDSHEDSEDLKKERGPKKGPDLQKELEKAERHFCVRPFEMLLPRARELEELGEEAADGFPDELRALVAKIRERASTAFVPDDDGGDKLQDPLTLLDEKLTRHRLNHSLSGACSSDPLTGVDAKQGRRRSCQLLSNLRSSDILSLLDSKLARRRSFQLASPALPGAAGDETGGRGSRKYLLDIVRGAPLAFGVDRMKSRSGACSPLSPHSRASGSSSRFSRVDPTESQNLGDVQPQSPSMGPPDFQFAPAVESASGADSISAADAAAVPKEPEEPEELGTLSASVNFASALRMMQPLPEEPAEKAEEPEPSPAESAQDVKQPRLGREATAPPELRVNFEVDEVDLGPTPPPLSSTSSATSRAYSPPPSPGGWPEVAEYRSPKRSMTLSTGQEVSLPPLPQSCRESPSFGAMCPGSLEAVREERRWMATVVPTIAAWKKPQLAPLPPGMKALGPISCRPRDHFPQAGRPRTRDRTMAQEQRPWRKAEAYVQVEEQLVQEGTPRATTSTPQNDWCSRHAAVWRTRFGEVEKAISTPTSRSPSKRRTATPIIPSSRPSSNK